MSMCACVCIPQLVDTQVAGAFTAGEKKKSRVAFSTVQLKQASDGKRHANNTPTH